MAMRKQVIKNTRERYLNAAADVGRAIKALESAVEELDGLEWSPAVAGEAENLKHIRAGLLRSFDAAGN